VAKDFFGNPVIGLPDMGAIELGGTAIPLPEAGFAEAPATPDGFMVTMQAVAGPYNTQYSFSEVSGNLGGNDSGWQLSPHFTDQGLLPNTVYAYTVTLRDAQGQVGSPSAPQSVLIPARSPFEDPIILSEDFTSSSDPANEAAPFPQETWYAAYEPEAQANSVVAAGGSLRLGWGYDHTLIIWQSSRLLNPAFAHRLSGDWSIETALDVHQGVIAGVGEFDPVSGELVNRIKEMTIGNLASPVAGQTGTFTLDISVAELAAAGVSRLNRVGVFFEHPGATSPSRNDVYRVDNLELVQIGNEADSDEDGVPDSVEDDLGLDSGNPTDGALDLDKDGWSNADEVLVGTNLDSSADFPSFALQPDLNLLNFDLIGAPLLPGRLYILESSSTLDAWTAVEAVPGREAPGPASPLFQIAPISHNAFFRVRIEWE
jgi:hypothetical protein